MTQHDEEEAAEPVELDHDDQDALATTRPLPLEATPSSAVATEQLPTLGHVGRYALKQCIGEGGLGTVYAAHDPLLYRLIAIKTLQVSLPQSEREQFNALFMNEAKAAGSLSHPYIVTVYDAGAGGNGAYIAMELLRGKDLRQLLAMGWRPTPAQAALIVRRVADAISYAHHKGVIHRDLKPANIFMVGRTQPRVLDFGIARIRQAGVESPGDGLSRFGEVVGGSPYYMAPEQIRRDPVDRRADVYALGVILYELLTGRRAFGGADLDAIHQSVLQGVVRPAHEVNREAPQALSEIAARAMSRDLVQRTRSARVLSQELRDWLDGHRSDRAAALSPLPSHGSPAAPPTSGAARERQLTRRVVWGAGVISLALLGAGAWLAWQRQVPSPDPSPLARAMVRAEVPVSSKQPLAAPASASASAAAEVTPAPPAASAASVALASNDQVVAPVKPVPPGTVRLAISPWGRVVVNRRVVGVTPPLTQLSLPPGRHVVTITNDESPPHTLTVQVRSGQSLTISHTF